jgi:hypothetical protein
MSIKKDKFLIRLAITHDLPSSKDSVYKLWDSIEQKNMVQLKIDVDSDEGL